MIKSSKKIINMKIVQEFEKKMFLRLKKCSWIQKYTCVLKMFVNLKIIHEFDKCSHIWKTRKAKKKKKEEKQEKKERFFKPAHGSRFTSRVYALARLKWASLVVASCQWSLRTAPESDTNICELLLPWQLKIHCLFVWIVLWQIHVLF